MEQKCRFRVAADGAAKAVAANHRKWQVLVKAAAAAAARVAYISHAEWEKFSCGEQCRWGETREAGAASAHHQGNSGCSKKHASCTYAAGFTCVLLNSILAIIEKLDYLRFVFSLANLATRACSTGATRCFEAGW